MPDSALRFTKLALRNVMGVENMEIELGALTMLSGKNGRGKTSVLDGVLALFTGDVTDLLTVGADTGEIRLELSDGTWFRRRFNDASLNVIEGGNDGGPSMKKPKAQLLALLDAVALNPIEILKADEERRAELILGAMPLTVTRAEIAAALDGVELPQTTRHRLLNSVDGRHALKVIDEVSTIVYDERTGWNRVARDKDTAAKQLRDTLPENAGDAAQAESEIARVDMKLANVRAREDARKREIREEQTASVREAERVRDEAIEKARAVYALAVEDAGDAARRAHDVLESTVRAEREPLVEQRGRLAAIFEQASTHARTLSVARDAEKDAAHAREVSEQLTAAIDRLGTLKTAKAEHLPIKGLSIRGGRVYLGDVPFSRANTGERVKAALRIAVARSDKHPVRLIVADGLESLDTEARDALVRNAPALGVQIIGAVVTDEPLLRVMTIEAPSEAVPQKDDDGE